MFKGAALYWALILAPVLVLLATYIIQLGAWPTRIIGLIAIAIVGFAFTRLSKDEQG